MARWRAVLGLVMGAFLLASGVAHTFLGGAEMTAEMTRAQVPEDLARGLTIGWNFGGAAMLVFGTIVIEIFRRGLRGEEVSTTPVLLIAGGYLVFGVWSLVASDLEPFFLVFVIPGLLLGAAARSLSARP